MLQTLAFFNRATNSQAFLKNKLINNDKINELLNNVEEIKDLRNMKYSSKCKGRKAARPNTGLDEEKLRSRTLSKWCH